MGFSENLVKALSIRNMSSVTLSARLGIPESEMNTYLTANVYPDASRLGEIAKALRMRVSDLCAEDGLHYSSFGQELRELRERNDLSAKELASTIDITPNNLYKMERNYYFPTAEVSARLLTLFGNDYAMIRDKYATHQSKAKIKATTPKPKKVFVMPPKDDEEKAYGKAIADAIKAARSNLGISMNYAAETLGVSPTTMVRLESGYIPKGELCTNLRKLLDVDVDKIKATKPLVIVKRPVVKAKPENGDVPTQTIKTDWLDYLDMIESDSEYRKAATAILQYVVNKKELPTLTDAPQASIILKLIQKGV